LLLVWAVVVLCERGVLACRFSLTSASLKQWDRRDSLG
jgi:hypothetical protein